MKGQPKDLVLSLDFTFQMVLEPEFPGCRGSPSKAESCRYRQTLGV